MERTRERLEELNLTRDEVERIGEALKNKEFRQLLVDYVEEIHDPENRKLYEQEITQLEKERGVDVTFINPTPGYVIKTSVDDTVKGFINICANENINKPTSTPTIQEGSRGLQWSLPHSLPPPREDIDNKGKRCKVFDVVFHPDTVHLAHKNKAFATMVNNTACDAVEQHFDVKLDRKNLKFPKIQYKGTPHAAVIRKPSGEKPVERSPEEQEFYDKLYAEADMNTSKPKKVKKLLKRTDDKSLYTTPKYIIKHRSHVDIQEFTESRDAKMNSAIPKELAVEINLPLLKSAGDISLDVTEKTLQLASEKPAKYKLNLTLPYSVNQDAGNAKFDKDTKKLVIILPVKRPSISLSDVCDSGFESDHGSTSLAASPNEEKPSAPGLIQEISDDPSDKTSESVIKVSSDFRTNFLDNDVHYMLPEYTCHIFDNVIAFTLNVKNADSNSVCTLFDDAGSSVHVKLYSISSSFYTIYYSFYIKFPVHAIDKENVFVEPWDNNVILQIPFNKSEVQLESYQVGIYEHDTQVKYVQEPAIINTVLEKATLEEITVEKIVDHNQEPLQEPSPVNHEMTPIEEVEEQKENTAFETKTNLNTEDQDDVFESSEKQRKSKAIDILSLSYESSGDELSYSYSPSKSKGILKRLTRKSFGRSISESSLDDYVCSSFENCHASIDSMVPEDGEVSRSLKKTVRFNDVVSRQLYRCNSSILGQKKKNQRKAKNKKKAQTRRASESDNSEVEDKKDDDSESATREDLKDSDEKDEDDDIDIFHIDIDV